MERSKEWGGNGFWLKKRGKGLRRCFLVRFDFWKAVVISLLLLFWKSQVEGFWVNKNRGKSKLKVGKGIFASVFFKCRSFVSPFR